MSDNGQLQADLRRPTPQRVSMNYFSSWTVTDTVVAIILALAVSRINLQFGRIGALAALIIAAGIVMGRYKWRRGYGRGYRALWHNLVDFYLDKIRRDKLWVSPEWSSQERSKKGGRRGS